MCGTRVCVVRTSVLVVVERAHHSTPWLHSFIHSFIPPRGVTPLRITSHRIARTVRSLSHARRRAPSRLGGFPQRGHHAFENVDARRRTIDPSIDARARRAHLFIPITLPTIPHHVPSKPFVSPCLGSRPVNQGHVSHHPDRGDSTDGISEARARGGFVAQLVERALCNDYADAMCLKTCARYRDRNLADPHFFFEKPKAGGNVACKPPSVRDLMKHSEL